MFRHIIFLPPDSVVERRTGTPIVTGVFLALILWRSDTLGPARKTIVPSANAVLIPNC